MVLSPAPVPARTLPSAPGTIGPTGRGARGANLRVAGVARAKAATTEERRMRFDERRSWQSIVRALVLVSYLVVDAHGPSRLRLRLHRLRALTAPIGGDL
jgi:hypothetical protein